MQSRMLATGVDNYTRGTYGKLNGLCGHFALVKIEVFRPCVLITYLPLLTELLVADITWHYCATNPSVSMCLWHLVCGCAPQLCYKSAKCTLRKHLLLKEQRQKPFARLWTEAKTFSSLSAGGITVRRKEGLSTARKGWVWTHLKLCQQHWSFARKTL